MFKHSISTLQEVRRRSIFKANEVIDKANEVIDLKRETMDMAKYLMNPITV